MKIGIYAKNTNFGQISPEILFKNTELVSISGNLGHFSFLEQPELIELYYLCNLNRKYNNKRYETRYFYSSHASCSCGAELM